MNSRGRKTPPIDPTFAAYPVRIAPSRIEGYGVFATASIPQGRKVIEYTGERLRLRQAYARLKKALRTGGPKRIYLFRLNRVWSIDGAVNGSGAECINHSCDPNLHARIIRGHILLFSRRRIHAGEELLLDYSFHPKAIRIRCRCGSSVCRGFLNRSN